MKRALFFGFLCLLVRKCNKSLIQSFLWIDTFYSSVSLCSASISSVWAQPEQWLINDRIILFG